MKTLSEILKNKTSPAVIFGHIHRRQEELRAVLRDAQRNRTYETATVEDLLDYAYIMLFFETLSLPYVLDTTVQLLEACRLNVGRGAAFDAAGIPEELRRANRSDARDRANKVMFGPKYQTLGVYRSIIHVDAREEKVAA